MLNKSHFDWYDMQELHEIGLIASMYPEAVQRLFAPIHDAPAEAGQQSGEGRQKDAA